MLNKGSCYQLPLTAARPERKSLPRFPSPGASLSSNLCPCGRTLCGNSFAVISVKFVAGELGGRKPPALAPCDHGLGSLLFPAVPHPALALRLSSRQSLFWLLCQRAVCLRALGLCTWEVCLPPVWMVVQWECLPFARWAQHLPAQQAARAVSLQPRAGPGAELAFCGHRGSKRFLYPSCPAVPV